MPHFIFGGGGVTEGILWGQRPLYRANKGQYVNGAGGQSGGQHLTCLRDWSLIMGRGGKF